MSDNKSRITELENAIGPLSSSDLCGCSVCVHENSLISELFIDGRFRSDIEFALQNKDAVALNGIANSERPTRYTNVSFPRHMSPSDYSAVIESSSASMKDIVNAASESQALPASDAPDSSDSPAS